MKKLLLFSTLALLLAGLAWWLAGGGRRHPGEARAIGALKSRRWFGCVFYPGLSALDVRRSPERYRLAVR